jgi:hypothetical protein
MRKNWLTTVGGIMGGCLGVPLIVAQAGYRLPGWLALTFVCIGAVGGVIVGVAAKGQDEHSTSAEVQAADIEKK